MISSLLSDLLSKKGQDGPVNGKRLPLRYSEAAGELTLEAGGMFCPLTIVFIAPDGCVRKASRFYHGNEIRIRRNELSPEKRSSQDLLFV